MDIQTQVALMTGGAALAGSIIGAVASFYTTRMLKREEWLRDERQAEISRREEVYLQMFDESYRLITQAVDNECLKSASALLPIQKSIARVRLLAGEDVRNKAKTLSECLWQYVDRREFRSDTIRDQVADALTAYMDAARRELEDLRKA